MNFSPKWLAGLSCNDINSMLQRSFDNVLILSRVPRRLSQVFSHQPDVHHLYPSCPKLNQLLLPTDITQTVYYSAKLGYVHIQQLFPLPEPEFCKKEN